MSKYTKLDKILTFVCFGYFLLSIFYVLEIRDYKNVISKQRQIINEMVYQEELQCREVYELTQKGLYNEIRSR